MSTKKSILVVEDEALVAEDLKEIIISLGYTVAGTADNSATAIALVREKSPDLITMDINLSGPVDGISTMEQIRKESDVPVIYVTAFTTDPIIERAKKTKPSGYIIKPFSERQIRSAFEIALYNNELERKVTERDMMIRALINATTNPLFLIDTTGTILAANEAMAGRAAGTPDKLHGMHVQQLINANLITNN
jgi:CheY-like chemotaxis protein